MITTTLPDLVARLEALILAATPEPCSCGHKAHAPGRCCVEITPAYEDGNSYEPAEYCDCGKVKSIDVAMLEEHAVQHLPTLLAELKRLQAEVANLTTDYSILSNDYVQLNLDVDALLSANERMRAALGRFHDFYIWLKLAEETGNIDPINDHLVIAQLMAGGGSDAITVGDLRRAAEAVEP